MSRVTIDDLVFECTRPQADISDEAMEIEIIPRRALENVIKFCENLKESSRTFEHDQMVRYSVVESIRAYAAAQLDLFEEDAE